MTPADQITWDELWFTVARAVSYRSRCIRKCGSVIVTMDNRVVSVGYNGPPANLGGTEGSCSDWCPHARRKLDGSDGEHHYGDCYSVHSEVNALAFNDRRDSDGGTIYITNLICWDCAKVVANSGLKRVAMLDDDANYRLSTQATNLLIGSGLIVEVLPPNFPCLVLK